MTEAFKCVKAIDCGFNISFTSAYWCSDLIYGVGVKTVPKYGCGPLAVFADLKDAKDYRSSFGGRIFRCKVVKSRRTMLKDDGYRFSISRSRGPWPSSFTAESVELISEITDEEYC